MGIERICEGCRQPIGMNHFSSCSSGYCLGCSAQIQAQAQHYQAQGRADKHDWERFNEEWYKCKHCGSLCNVLADYNSTIYGCTEAKRQEHASRLWTVEKEVHGERLPDVPLIESKD